MTHGSRAGEVRDPISQCDFGSLDFFAGSDEEFGSSPRGVENTRAFLSTCLRMNETGHRRTTGHNIRVFDLDRFARTGS